jgi:hypothetical protein
MLPATSRTGSFLVASASATLSDGTGARTRLSSVSLFMLCGYSGAVPPPYFYPFLGAGEGCPERQATRTGASVSRPSLF